MANAQRLAQNRVPATEAHQPRPELRSLFHHTCFRAQQRQKQLQRQQFRPQAAQSASASCRHKRHSRTACKALAAPVTPPAQKIVDIPFGDTAGANLIMENVTVQAGHRDLLEVRLCCVLRQMHDCASQRMYTTPRSIIRPCDHAVKLPCRTTATMHELCCDSISKYKLPLRQWQITHTHVHKV